MGFGGPKHNQEAVDSAETKVATSSKALADELLQYTPAWLRVAHETVATMIRSEQAKHEILHHCIVHGLTDTHEWLQSRIPESWDKDAVVQAGSFTSMKVGGDVALEASSHGENLLGAFDGERNPTNAKAVPGTTVKNGMTLFFHARAPLSNWHPADFQVRGVPFTCVEQFMMWSKAKLFGDNQTAEAILRTRDPKTQKALGRAVKGFSEATWVAHRKAILVEGCREKFEQNPHLKAVLLGTTGTALVEASPYDRIWGCGLSADDPKIVDRRNWRGENLLGQVLEEVRENLGRCGSDGTAVPEPEGTKTPRLDFKKLGEKMQYEREHGPRLDQEWAEGRASGTIPIFQHETHDAILTGNTFAVKDQIKHMLGKWDGGRKAWVVPAIGADYCDRSNFDYVQKLQQRLDDLKNKGVVITYVAPGQRI